ncbi:MAG: carbohydrate binding domain-containing protein, partial [Gaiellaceae bacterium]
EISDGSCTANACAATKVGAHTVTALYSSQRATSPATLTVTAGPLDHLALTPAPATVAAGAAQAYSVQGRDAYDNSLGDRTAATTFTIAPDGSCTGSSCTATLAGPHTVTGSSGSATGTASLQVTAGAAIARIVIAPAAATIAAGATQVYSAQGYDAANNPIGDVTAATGFSIADGSCSGSSCTATSAGDHTVSAHAGSAGDTALLTVTATALDRILVSPGSATIASGGSQTYTAEGRDQYNNSLGDISADVTFTSSAGGTCTGATCTGSTAGTRTVTATEFGKTGTATLQVTSGTLDHILISPGSATIDAGGTQTYATEGFDAAGNSLGDFTLGTTLTISPDGSCTSNTCTATTAGAHTVTAINNGETSSAVLTVNPGALDHLVLAPSSATIVPGGSQTYTAFGRDQYENRLGNQNAITTFTIDPDGSCSGATCTAAVDGSHTVTATVGEITGSATLQVTEAAAIDHIVVSPSPAAIGAGDTQTYSVEAFDAQDNSRGDVSGSATFTISPDGSCSGNVCSATTAGPHTVTGSAVGKSDSAALTVSAGPLDHLSLSPSSALIAPDNSQSYSADGFDQYGNTLGDVTADTAFTIDPDGTCTANLCTASLEGTHTVTGSSLGATSSAVLTVSSTPVDHISISPASASIVAGASQTYTADAIDGDGNVLGDITGSTGFSITPDGSCSGDVCTATVAGGHTVTGTSGGNSSTAALTVTPASLDHLALSPASATITSGGSQTYSAEGVGRFGNSLGDVTAGTTFTIGPDGTCTGNTCSASTAGTHTVTGHDGGKTGTASLQVAAGPLDHIVISPPTATITAGGSRSYSAEGFDASHNSLGDVTSSTVFTILPNGSCPAATCTATSAGAHTVTGNDGGKTSSATLTVIAGPLDHLALSPASSTITAGGSAGYTVQGRDRFNNLLGDMSANTTFTITPDGSCAAAVCSATTAGAHTVTGTSVGVTGTAALQVDPSALDHLVLSPASATVVASQTYTAQGRDQYDNSLGNMTASTTFTIVPDGSCTGATCTAGVGGLHTVTGARGGATGTAALTIDASSVDRIAISPGSATITAGGSQPYTAQALDAAGNVLGDVTSATTFTIAPDGSCTATSCTASKAGSHTVTATEGGKTSNATLSVSAGPLHHLALSPASVAIIPGGSQTYSAEGRDQYDNSLGDVTASTTLTIGPNGSCTGATCTASTSGAHTVTGSDGGKTGTASLQVASGMLDHIVIGPAAATIDAGGSKTYTAQAFDASENPLGDVTSNTVFTIIPDDFCTGAVCKATRAGVHTVTGTYAGKVSSTTLSVNAGPLDHLALSPASATISAGGPQSYTVQGRDQYDNPLGDLTAGTTFTISPNGSCTGAVCTAASVGPHTVTATAVGATGTASLQVNAAALDHLTLSPATATLANGGSQAYTAQGFDANGNSLGNVTASTTFTIAPNGSCTAASCTASLGGPHTVTGTNAGKTTTAALNVDYVKNPGFETDLSGWNASGSGANVTLTRVAGGHSGGWAALLRNTGTTTSTFATLQDAPNWVAATTAGTYTGTIWVRADSAGALLKLKFQEFSTTSTTPVGSAVTQATLSTSWQQVSVRYTITSPGSQLDFQAFVANPAPGTAFYADDAAIFQTGTAVDHIAVSPRSASIVAGGSQAFTAQAFDAANNSLGDVTASTTFTINPGGACTGASCGASGAGVYTVTGTSGGKSATASLQVSPGPLDHLVLSPASASVTAGVGQAFTAQGRDRFENSLGDVTAATTFSIAPDGSCTGASCTASVSGPHTVTGSDGGKTGTASLQVNPAGLDHLVLSPPSASIGSGGAKAYTAQGRDRFENSLGDVTAATTFTITPDGSCTGASCTASVSGPHTVTGSDGGKTGTATLSVTSAVDHILISPGSATIVAGGSQAFTAQAFDAANNSLGDVTASTTFTIAPDGACTGATCTASVAGPHTVTGTNAGKTNTAALGVSLVTNPGFETDLTGWNTSGSGAGVTLSRVAGGHSGGSAALLRNTGTTTATFATLQDAPNWVKTTAAGTYTGSIWVRADTAGGVLKLKFQEFSPTSSTAVGSAVTQVSLTTSWQQVSVRYTITSPGSTLDFQAYLANPPPGTAFYADDAAIVPG